jgi:hypothetical protein
MKIDAERLPRLYQEHPRLLRANVMGTMALAGVGLALSVAETISSGNPAMLVSIPVEASVGFNAFSFFRDNCHES